MLSVSIHCFLGNLERGKGGRSAYMDHGQAYLCYNQVVISSRLSGVWSACFPFSVSVLAVKGVCCKLHLRYGEGVATYLRMEDKWRAFFSRLHTPSVRKYLSFKWMYLDVF